MPNVPPGYVMLTSKNPIYRVFGRQGDGRWILSGGGGRWEEVQRPKRTSLTQFVGDDPCRLTGELILDGMADGADQEPFVSNLRRIAGHEQTPQPSTLKVEGPGIPGQIYDWVIDGLDFGEAIVDPSGITLRQNVNLTLLQYVRDVRLTNLSAANQARAGASNQAAGKKYTVKAGEHLGEIAAKVYGNSQKWRDIAKLNNIRDPAAVKVGQVLRMP